MEGLEKHYAELANAVIIQASQDYVQLKNCKKEYFKSSGFIVSKNELDIFFKSKWFGQLTTLDPDYLLRLLNEGCKNGEIKAKYRGKI